MPAYFKLTHYRQFDTGNGEPYADSVIRSFRRTRFDTLLSVATLLSVLSLSASSLAHNDSDDALCNPAIAAPITPRIG